MFLVVFGKYFVFTKMSKIFKNSVALFWRLSCGLAQSQAPVASSLRDFSQLTGESVPKSRKRLRKFFQNLSFALFAAHFGSLFAGGKFNREGYSEIFAAQLATPSRVDLPVAKNT